MSLPRSQATVSCGIGRLWIWFMATLAVKLCGFLVNKDILSFNMGGITLKAFRTVYDGVKHMRCEIHEVLFSKDLLLSCKQSCKWKWDWTRWSKDASCWAPYIVLSKSCFRFRIGLTYHPCCMSGRRLRSRKIAGKAEKEEITKEESAMSDAILEELKSLWSDLTQQMQKTSDEHVTFQGSTNTWLTKIESVISKIDEIDDLKPKVEKLEEDAGGMKQSVNITLNETRNLFQECNVELKTRVEHLERYSRDFNIRVIGVVEQDGEDCLSIIQDYLTLLGFKDDAGKIENTHRTGRKREEKPRNIIVKLYSRPFKRELLCVAKNQKNKWALTELDLWKTLPLMTWNPEKSTPDHERGVRPRQECLIYKRGAFHRWQGCTCRITVISCSFRSTTAAVFFVANTKRWIRLCSDSLCKAQARTL